MFSFFTYQIPVNNNSLPNINQIITKYAKLETTFFYFPNNRTPFCLVSVSTFKDKFPYKHDPIKKFRVGISASKS
jgi:hypothetical protein